MVSTTSEAIRVFASYDQNIFTEWHSRYGGRGILISTQARSWMNLVERWFSALTTKKLQRSAHTSVNALAADIRAWVKNWNEDPKPFVWHKTADEILQRLAGYCTAVNQK